MLHKSTIARRYASAVLSLSQEFNVLDEVYADFKTLKQLLHDSPEFHNFLNNPVINAKQKAKIINKILENNVQPLIIKLLEILVRYNRGSCLGEIIDVYIELYIDQKGILPVHLTTAQPMNDHEKALLRAPLETMTNKTVTFEETIDEAIIGGFIADFSAYRIDASVRKTLDEYHKKLSKSVF